MILPEVSVTASRLQPLPEADAPKTAVLDKARVRSSDTARLLDGMAGVSIKRGWRCVQSADATWHDG